MTDASPTAAIDALFEGQPPMMKVSELAPLLRMSGEGITKWIRRGTLPAVQFDAKAWRVFRDDVRDLQNR